MGVSTKSLKLSRYGFSNNHKKTGINLWRFFMDATNSRTGAVKKFFIEFEILNPHVSPQQVQLGFTPRVKISPEDLQYALAGTQAAREIQSEEIVQPSYAVVRIGTFGAEPRQLCSYAAVDSLKFNSKPFEIQMGNKYFSDDKLSGFIDISAEEKEKHPEYFCDSGFARWNLSYHISKDYNTGYKDKSYTWFPYGLKTDFSGTISFDGDEYLVEDRKSKGYMDRSWGSSLPQTWFFLNSRSLTSIISGRTLLESTFTIQGVFEDRLSFIANIEGIEINFTADAGKRLYTNVWSCVQAPESDEDELLHWSVSINNKNWVIDVDIFCKVSDLYNRNLELPEGERMVLDMLLGGTGYGEIKLYKRIKNDLEQIEYIKVENAQCEFGHVEKSEI